MPESRTFFKPILVIFAGTMAVTAMVLNGITWSKVRKSINASESALAKRDHWENLLSSLKDAETGVRGYVITGDESYLKPFEWANASVGDVLGELRVLSERDGGEVSTVNDVEGLVRGQMDSLKEIKSVREREDFEAARALIMEGKSKALMDHLRSLISALTKRQQSVVNERTLVMNRDLRWGYASALGAGMVAIGTGLVAFVLLRESLLHARREDRLAEEKRRAENSNREKSVFLATMSHEIRTPMNAILGFGELLRDHVGDEKGKQYANSILAGGRSLLQIINDILDLSKVEAGMLELKPQPTDLRETVRFIRQLFAFEASKRGIELRANVQDDVPASLLIDHLRLRQILVNVVGNALKFTESGHVSLRMTAKQRETELSQLDVCIEIEDTGKGIPEEQQEMIFKPFVQVGGARQGEAQGTGLGLAIVRRLTDLMEGSVTLESEPGRGSVFRFEFPGIEISSRIALSTMDDDAPIDFNDLTPSHLLVVDDNETNLALVAGIFEGSHHTLRQARNGKEALEAITDELPNLVMIDVRMPVMDGHEALAAIRARNDWKLLPVVAVTASSLPEERESLLEKFDGYVRKPFSRAQLYEQLAQFIRPHVTAHALDAPDPCASATPPEGMAGKWTELAQALGEIHEADWPGIRDGMVVSEVHAFASSLESLANRAGCAPLQGYTRRLHSDADSFSPGTLERTLLEFPAIIETIWAATRPSSA